MVGGQLDTDLEMGSVHMKAAGISEVTPRTPGEEWPLWL